LFHRRCARLSPLPGFTLFISDLRLNARLRPATAGHKTPPLREGYINFYISLTVVWLVIDGDSVVVMLVAKARR
jgi:hypothetical protein